MPHRAKIGYGRVNELATLAGKGLYLALLTPVLTFIAAEQKLHDFHKPALFWVAVMSAALAVIFLVVAYRALAERDRMRTAHTLPSHAALQEGQAEAGEEEWSTGQSRRWTRRVTGDEVEASGKDNPPRT
jgi:Na+/melibiose symporter-like transporter